MIWSFINTLFFIIFPKYGVYFFVFSRARRRLILSHKRNRNVPTKFTNSSLRGNLSNVSVNKRMLLNNKRNVIDGIVIPVILVVGSILKLYLFIWGGLILNLDLVKWIWFDYKLFHYWFVHWHWLFLFLFFFFFFSANLKIIIERELWVRWIWAWYKGDYVSFNVYLEKKCESMDIKSHTLDIFTDLIGHLVVGLVLNMDLVLEFQFHCFLNDRGLRRTLNFNIILLGFNFVLSFNIFSLVEYKVL